MKHFCHDSVDTASRRRELERYVREALLTDARAFICPHCASTCRPSVERSSDLALIAGEMPHMGEAFSLIDEQGRRTRIVVVGQERGRGEPIVTLAQRTRAIQLRRDPSLRRGHLRGTTHALLLMFGLRADGREGEFISVDGTRAHVLDCFALTNSTLCSALKVNATTGLPTTKGRPTDEMRTACAGHLRAMLAIWEPTVLVLQGVSARKTASDALGTAFVQDAAADVRIGSTHCRVCPVTHPNSHSPKSPDLIGWIHPTSLYFRETLTPMLTPAL